MSTEEQNKENEENLVSREKHKRRKWVIKKRISIAAFVSTVLIGVYLLVSPLFLSPEMADILESFNPILVSIIGINSSIIMVFFGASAYEDTHGTKMEDQ